MTPVAQMKHKPRGSFQTLGTDMKNNISTLKHYGFTCIGRWGFGDYKSTKHLSHMKGLKFTIDEHKKTKGFVYAFSVEDEVVYVGETTQLMGGRFLGYRYGNPYKPDTDNRVKLHITDSLEKNLEVKIWFYSQCIKFKFANENLQISINKPIEEELIRRLSPPLNNKKTKQPQPVK